MKYINYNAITDPEFNGSFDHYHKVESVDLVGHLSDINRIVMATKPKDKDTVIFYSVPDARGMKFLRVNLTGKGAYVMSDFRYEWV